MADLRLENLGKLYPGGVRAVAGISLHVPDGRFCVLVGPSGCGKSTLLRMVAGLETVTEGTISIGGQAVNQIPPKDRDVAMVFQNFALYPHLSVFDNLAFGLKMRGLKGAAIDERVRWASGILGLSELLARKPAALSGGQRQRVALGRAIVRQPRVFLFDEPLSNLDTRLRLEMRTELQRLHQQLKTTTLYVTHDQEEALSLGELIVVIDGGQVQQVGTPRDVYRHPANRFVAGFIGTPPMAFTEGVLRRNHAGLCIESNHQRTELPATLTDRLTSQIDQPVVLGVRPEAMTIADVATAHFEPAEPQIFARGPYGANLCLR